jgi:hypothetical protein
VTGIQLNRHVCVVQEAWERFRDLSSAREGLKLQVWCSSGGLSLKPGTRNGNRQDASLSTV